jgi:hypothetical protein
MVSIEQFEYLKKIDGNWKTKLFHDLITEKKLDLSITNSNLAIDLSFIGFLKSVSENNKSGFSDIYSDFSKRKPSTDSPWIYDNYLIFIIITGIIKYQIDKSWILEIINFRHGTNIELKDINITFINILKENYSSKDNLFEIIFVFQEQINIPLSPVEEINQLYENLSSNPDLLIVRDDFIKLIRLRAIDIIILKKELPNTKEISSLKSFKITFLNRVKILGKMINLILILFLILGIILIRANSQESQDFIDSISVVLGVMGIGLIAFLKWVSKQISNVILWITSYTKYFNDY